MLEDKMKTRTSPTENTLYHVEENPRRFDLLFFLHVYTNIIELMLLFNMHVSIRLKINKTVTCTP